MTQPILAAWSGSDVSVRVLEVASQFAEQRGVPLRVMLGWDFIDQPGTGFDPEITPEKVQKMLDDAVAGLREQHPGLVITSEAHMGWAPSVICDAAEFASMLVVGRSSKSEGHFGDWSPDVLVKRVRVPVVYVP
jgi:hypothetical protein